MWIDAHADHSNLVVRLVLLRAVGKRDDFVADDFIEADVIRPMITVEKIVDMAVASPGDYLTYTIYYNNTGSGTANATFISVTSCAISIF